MKVEIADESLSLLPEFSGDQAGTSTASGGLDCPVTWPKEKLSKVSGRTVRFRIHLKRGQTEPRLYAVTLAAP